MYEVDFARGLAYKGKRGFIIRVEPKGCYVKTGLFKKVYLKPENTIILSVSKYKGKKINENAILVS